MQVQHVRRGHVSSSATLGHTVQTTDRKSSKKPENRGSLPWSRLPVRRKRVDVSKAASAPALGPESRDREARKRALVEAAITLFADEGYGGVSTRAVAERAGCSETLLFRYFRGKRGLL